MERDSPRQDWIPFLNEFSRQQQGWLATLEVIGQNVGDEVSVKSLLLHGVTFEEKGRDRDAVSIFLG